MRWPNIIGNSEGDAVGDRGDGLGLSIPGLMVALTLLGVVLFQHVPLETTRPPPEGQLPDASVTAERAPARLWQDPFAAVYRHRRAAEAAARTMGSAGVWRPTRNICRAETIGIPPVELVDPYSTSAPQCIADQIVQRYASGQAPRLLAVILPGGSFAESGESRIRRRYAVLSALHLADLVPDDATHIGYIRTSPDTGLPALIPYEWMTAGGSVADTGPLVVLWLDETALRQRFHGALSRLVTGLLPKERLPSDGALDVTVLGPSSSDGLVELLREADEAANPSTPGDTGTVSSSAAGTAGDEAAGLSTGTPSAAEPALAVSLHIYSPTATTADAELFERAGVAAGDESVAEFLRSRLNLHLHRTIVDDRTLADSLAVELAAREGWGPEGPGLLLRLAIGLRNLTGWLRDATIGRLLGTTEAGRSPTFRRHVVLVSEWDTAYGRSLPISVCKAIRRRQAEQQVREPSCDGLGAGESADGGALTPVHRFTYLRGLDGTLAAGEPNTDVNAAGETPAEAAHGTPQLDYLRRLADRLTALERSLPRGDSISTIGILGSDIHDKLLILQALRPAFQTAVFFTTDLDARLYERAVLPSTRGLVVASGFGLQLDKVPGPEGSPIDCQGPIPPFRSGYQTAFFYAALDALGALPVACRLNIAAGSADRGAGGSAQAPVHLFEIGRNGPVALPSLGGKNGSADPDAAGGADLSGDSNARTRFNDWLNVALLIAIGWGLFHLLYHRRTPRWARTLTRRLRRRPLGTGLALLLGVVVICGLLIWLWSDLILLACPLAAPDARCAEPFSVANGISIWVPIYLQLLAVVLSLLFIVRMMMRFRANMRGLSRRYFLERGCGVAPRQMPPALGAAMRSEIKGWAERLRRLAHVGRRASDPSAVGGPGQEAGLADGTSEFAVPLGADRALRLWLRYCRRSHFWRRVVRVVVMSLLLLAVVSALYMATGGGGNSPVRDSALARIYLELRLLGVFLGGMLAFAVLDVTLECRRFIDRLSRASVAGEPVRWPDQVAAGFRAHLNLDPDRLSPWIALSVISEHADLVMRLVLYPMIVLVVLVVARLPWLDTISLPPSILILYLVFAFYIFFVAVGIQRAANAAKARTREHYQSLLDGNRNAPEPDTRAITQLECLIRQITEMHDGAFKPLPARPLVRMALLPFGALGMGLLELFG
jgi:hypothetical protein